MAEKNELNLEQKLDSIVESFGTPKCNLLGTTNLFISCIFDGYEANDYSQNALIIEKVKKVEKVLEERLALMNANSDASRAKDVRRAIYIVTSTMKPFYEQAMKYWD